jgi:hypothetical protein
MRLSSRRRSVSDPVRVTVPPVPGEREVGAGKKRPHLGQVRFDGRLADEQRSRKVVHVEAAGGIRESPNQVVEAVLRGLRLAGRAGLIPTGRCSMLPIEAVAGGPDSMTRADELQPSRW